MTELIDTSIPQPPRHIGRNIAQDVQAQSEWLWDFYKKGILEGQIQQTADIGDTLEIQFPNLYTLGTTVGVPGGIPYFVTSESVSTSAALAEDQIVLGGGSGQPPATLGSLGTATTVLHGNATGAPTFGPVVLTSDVSGVLPPGNGGTGLSSLGSANQVLGVDAAGTAAEYKSVLGTTNQITVTHGLNSITLSLPQNIHTAATPTFAGLTLTGNLVMSGTAANIELGANYISRSGTDAGLSLDASNNATFSAALGVTGDQTNEANLRLGNAGSADIYLRMRPTTLTGNWSAFIQLAASNTQYNWQIATNSVTAGSLTIRPSTAGGGTTFSTDAVHISGATGNVGINGIPALGKLQVLDGSAGGGTVNSSANELVIEGSGNIGMTFLGTTSSLQSIRFADAADDGRGIIRYDHSTDTMILAAAGSTVASIASGAVTLSNVNLITNDGTATERGRLFRDTSAFEYGLATSNYNIVFDASGSSRQDIIWRNGTGAVGTGTERMRLSTTTLTLAGDLAVNGGDMTTSASTFNMLAATAATVNAFSAATTLNFGAATGTLTVANTTLAAKAITASTTLAVTGTSTLTGAVYGASVRSAAENTGAFRSPESSGASSADPTTITTHYGFRSQFSGGYGVSVEAWYGASPQHGLISWSAGTPSRWFDRNYTNGITTLTTTMLQFGGATTGNQYLQMSTTGAALRFGVERSAGASLFTGGTAYATVLGTTNSTVLQFATNGTVRQTIDTSGNHTFTGDLTVSGGDITLVTYSALRAINYGFSAAYTAITVGAPASLRGSVALATDVSAIAGGTFNGQHQVVIGYNGILFPNNAATNFVGGMARNSSDQILLGPLASSGITSGPLMLSTTGGTLTGTLAVTSDTTLTGDLAVNGGDLTSSSATFNFVATPTTLAMGAAATTASIGAATGTFTVNNTTLAAKAITASTTLAVTGASTLTGNVGIGVAAPTTRAITVQSSVTGTNALGYEDRTTLTSNAASSIVTKMLLGNAGGIVSNHASGITVAATLYVYEPNITLTLGSVTTAASLYIASAPTEGGSNFALISASGMNALVGQTLTGASSLANSQSSSVQQYTESALTYGTIINNTGAAATNYALSLNNTTATSSDIYLASFRTGASGGTERARLSYNAPTSRMKLTGNWQVEQWYADYIGVGAQAVPSSVYVIDLGSTQNNTTAIRTSNISTGTAATAGFYATVNGTNTSSIFTSTGSGYTPSGTFAPALATLLYSDSGMTGGLSIAAREANADVRIYAGGIADGDLVATFSDAQLVTLTGDLAVNGGDLTSSSATFNFVATPTTLAMGAAATTASIGAATGTFTVNNATLQAKDIRASAGGVFTVSDAVTNAVTDVFYIKHLTSGTAAVGYGAGLTFTLESAAGTERTAGRVAALWTTATDGAEISAIILSPRTGGAPVEELRVVPGLTTLAGDLAINGGDLTTGASTLNAFTATATTVNAFTGASTGLTLGHADGATRLNGRVAINAAPAGWELFSTIDLDAGGGALASTANTMFTLSNAYWDAITWKRKAENAALYCVSSVGQSGVIANDVVWEWASAPTDTAGTDITWTSLMTLNGAGTMTLVGPPTVMSSTAIPAGGTTGSGYKFSSTANFGVFFGSGVPTLSAAKGSIYLRSDGSSTTTRVYINTDGGTTWTACTTVA